MVVVRYPSESNWLPRLIFYHQPTLLLLSFHPAIIYLSHRSKAETGYRKKFLSTIGEFVLLLLLLTINFLAHFIFLIKIFASSHDLQKCHRRGGGGSVTFTKKKKKKKKPPFEPSFSLSPPRNLECSSLECNLFFVHLYREPLHRSFSLFISFFFPLSSM